MMIIYAARSKKRNTIWVTETKKKLSYEKTKIKQPKRKVEPGSGSFDNI